MDNMEVDEMEDIVIDETREESFEPRLGMEFPSEQAAFDFYNAYGYITGFSIRTQTNYKNVKGIITTIRLVCSKEGFSRKKPNQLKESLETVGGLIEKTPKKERSMKRCGCKAACHVRMHKDGIWRITGLYKEHNHELVQNTPSKKRHLQSHKHISLEDRTHIELLCEQNVGASQIREFLAEKVGGKTNLHFSKKDVHNHITSMKRSLVGVDMNAMLDFFKRCQLTDSDFFFNVEPDEDNVAKNIFWVDGRSRRAYREFGDVIIFDTTYNTNKYRMPFAPFVGVNHHQQSIFFGCALVRDEKKTTFCWLFKTWLQVMGGKKPKTIFTDQDPAMKAAIEVVFGGGTVHRVCLWHVLRKAREHLGVLYGSVPGFRDELIAVINLSWTISDFIQNWCATLEKYKMEDNPHLTLMFDKRDEWAPAYFRETFCAGICTTQRSESMNAATKIWLGSNASLYDFATKFQKMVEGVYERESDEDFRTLNETPQLLSGDGIEVEARQVYTRSIFSLLKERIKKTIALRVREIERERLYEVRPARIQSNYKWYKPNRMVLIDRVNARADCDCQGFLFQGVLCSHALVVMRHVGMEPFFPTCYILKRWTRDANANSKKGINGHCFEGNDLQSIRRNAITKRMEKLVNKVVGCTVAYDWVCSELDEMDANCSDIIEAYAEEIPTKGIAISEIVHEDSLKFSDPPVSQCKGTRKPQRFKPPSEIKDVKKMRTCSYCHKKEGHNSRRCPKKIREEVASKGKEPISIEEADENESECKSEDDESESENETDFKSEDMF